MRRTLETIRAGAYEWRGLLATACAIAALLVAKSHQLPDGWGTVAGYLDVALGVVSIVVAAQARPLVVREEGD